MFYTEVSSISMHITERQKKIDEKNLSVTCVIPVHNEEALIESFIVALKNQLSAITHHYEIIAVDDGSTDRSVQNIIPLTQEGKVKLMVLSRNFGKEHALMAGLEHSQSEVTIVLDSDFQHPLEIIPEFIAAWAQGYDMVYGVRTDRKDETKLKRSMARLFYRLLQKISKTSIPSDAGDFRLLDRKVVNALNSMEERSRFTKGLYAWVGFEQIAMEYTVSERPAGKSSWNFRRLASLALTGITSFSDIPLRVWGIIGFFISFFALIYGVYTIIAIALDETKNPGFSSLMTAIAFLGGIQLLSIGVLGEYVSRVFNEVKKRPPYIVARKYGFADEGND